MRTWPIVARGQLWHQRSPSLLLCSRINPVRGITGGSLGLRWQTPCLQLGVGLWQVQLVSEPRDSEKTRLKAVKAAWKAARKWDAKLFF